MRDTPKIETALPMRLQPILAAALAVSAASWTSAAPTSGTSAYFVRDKTEDGHAFVCGGVSVDDRQSMQAERSNYTLWVSTVAKPSGAYLADVQLKVTELKQQHVVAEHTMEGPWCLIDLPPGRYLIEARFQAEGSPTEQVLKQTVSVTRGVLRQSVLRFDSKAEVSPDLRSGPATQPEGAPARP